MIFRSGHGGHAVRFAGQPGAGPCAHLRAGALPEAGHSGRGPGHRRGAGAHAGGVSGGVPGQAHSGQTAPGLPEAGRRAGQEALFHRRAGHSQSGAALAAGVLPQLHSGRLCGQLRGGSGHLLQASDLLVPARQRHRAGHAAHSQLRTLL